MCFLVDRNRPCASTSTNQSAHTNTHIFKQPFLMSSRKNATNRTSLRGHHAGQHMHPAGSHTKARWTRRFDAR